MKEKEERKGNKHPKKFFVTALISSESSFLVREY